MCDSNAKQAEANRSVSVGRPLYEMEMIPERRKIGRMHLILDEMLKNGALFICFNEF